MVVLSQSCPEFRERASQSTSDELVELDNKIEKVISNNWTIILKQRGICYHNMNVQLVKCILLLAELINLIYTIKSDANFL